MAIARVIFLALIFLITIVIFFIDACTIFLILFVLSRLDQLFRLDIKNLNNIVKFQGEGFHQSMVKLIETSSH